jgi:hypothetical protein
LPEASLHCTEPGCRERAGNSARVGSRTLLWVQEAFSLHNRASIDSQYVAMVSAEGLRPQGAQMMLARLCYMLATLGILVKRHGTFQGLHMVGTVQQTVLLNPCNSSYPMVCSSDRAKHVHTYFCNGLCLVFCQQGVTPPLSFLYIPRFCASQTLRISECATWLELDCRSGQKKPAAAAFSTLCDAGKHRLSILEPQLCNNH